jgi:hypothetical protein
MSVSYLQDYSAYTNLEECRQFITDYMEKHGPFDGLMGFSMVGSTCNIFLYSVIFPSYINKAKGDFSTHGRLSIIQNYLN